MSEAKEDIRWLETSWRIVASRLGEVKDALYEIEMENSEFYERVEKLRREAVEMASKVASDPQTPPKVRAMMERRNDSRGEE